MRAQSIGILVLLGMALACQPATAQSIASNVSAAPAQSTTASVRDAFTVHAGGKTLTPVFRDSTGHAMAASAFSQAIKHGRHFRLKPDLKHQRAVLTLLPKGSSAGTSMMALPKPKIHVGQDLPNFTLPTVTGGSATPASLHGKPTLVDFFFATCVGCIEELPAMNAYMARHPDMHFLAITYDDADTARAFVKKRGLRWPVAYAGKPLITKLGIHAYPTLLLLDANGHLQAIHTGSMPIHFTPSSGRSSGTPDAEATRQSQMKWLTAWVKKHS